MHACTAASGVLAHRPVLHPSLLTPDVPTAGNSLGVPICPEFATSAVLEGAVRFLQQPWSIYQRVSTLTYGIKAFAPWTPDMPDALRQQDASRKDVTDRGFLAFVRKGDIVQVGTLCRWDGGRMPRGSPRGKQWFCAGGREGREGAERTR